MITPEKIQQGWVKFSRCHCTEGCIDIWYSDVANNLNNEHESRWNLNSFISFIRLNGEGEWYPNGFRGGLMGFTCEMAEAFTSQEIWGVLKLYNY
ncbi:MAG TPA: hypothetical protein PKC87_01320 [Candidatus Absconditabacterales bacterium]|nr:hypothetical protein [Candidatus Absconditabacterales bacterium]